MLLAAQNVTDAVEQAGGSYSWTIENRTHYVRDVTFGEDAGGAAQGNTAHSLAALRNGLLTLFRRAHWRSIPDALAHYGASVAPAFALIGLEVKT